VILGHLAPLDEQTLRAARIISPRLAKASQQSVTAQTSRAGAASAELWDVMALLGFPWSCSEGALGVLRILGHGQNQLGGAADVGAASMLDIRKGSHTDSK